MGDNHRKIRIFIFNESIEVRVIRLKMIDTLEGTSLINNSVGGIYRECLYQLN